MKTKLGNELNKLYNEALKGEQVLNIHLFGIKYGEFIILNGIKPIEIIRAADLNESYATELSKGIKLSNFVVMK